MEKQVCGSGKAWKTEFFVLLCGHTGFIFAAVELPFDAVSQ